MKLTECSKQKLQMDKNAGFSLVEVLIAMAVLAVVSLPILSAFSNAARINAKARRVENANTAAQDVAEQFKSLSIDQLKDLYNGKWSESGGIYQFTVTNPTGNSNYEGLNGEQFDVTVRLDPGAYTDGTPENGNTNNAANNINSYVPQYSNLNAADNIVIMKEVYQSDTEALAAFKTQYGVTLTASQLKKSLELDVDITQNSDTNFIENVTGKLTYTYNGTYTVNREFTKSKSITAPKKDAINTVSKNEGLENVFLLYTPYDKNTTTVLPGMSNAYLSSDSITINYNYPTSTTVNCADCNVYIVQQDVTSAVNSSYKMYLDKDKVSVHVNDADGSATKDLATVGTLNLGTGIETGPVSIFSNIYGWSSLKKSSDNRGNSITSNESGGNTDSLYTMTISVSLNSDTLATVSTTKEN